MPKLFNGIHHACSYSESRPGLRQSKSQELSSINQGILVLLGVEKDDTEKDADYILEKTINLRIFEDEQDKMNLSLLDIEGADDGCFAVYVAGRLYKGTPSFIWQGGRTGQGQLALRIFYS